MTFINPELLTFLGIISAIGFSLNGSSYASSNSGAYITRYLSSKTVIAKSDWWKPLIPIVISGVLAIYGFIIALLLCFKFQTFTTDTIESDRATSYKYLAAGLSVGLSCLHSGSAIHDFLQDFIYFYSAGPMIGKDTTTTTITEPAEPSLTLRESQNPLEAPLISSMDRRTISSKGIPTTTVTSLPEPTIHFCMVLVYLEAIGLYGFIIALVLIHM
jgi:ATP synthase proteolipid subunit